MATCIHTVECGPLGEVDLTISYKYRPFRAGRGSEPDERESACIYWIKIGGESGVEVAVADDYIIDEIIPACVADWNSGADGESEYRTEHLYREAA